MKSIFFLISIMSASLFAGEFKSDFSKIKKRFEKKLGVDIKSNGEYCDGLQLEKLIQDYNKLSIKNKKQIKEILSQFTDLKISNHKEFASGSVVIFKDPKSINGSNWIMENLNFSSNEPQFGSDVNINENQLELRLVQWHDNIHFWHFDVSVEDYISVGLDKELAAMSDEKKGDLVFIKNYLSENAKNAEFKMEKINDDISCDLINLNSIVSNIESKSITEFEINLNEIENILHSEILINEFSKTLGLKEDHRKGLDKVIESGTKDNSGQSSMI